MVLPSKPSFTYVDEVLKVLPSSNKTFSPSDPFPSQLIASVSNILYPYLVDLFNCSFATGTFPAKFKHAYVKPLLKKPNLDPESLSNYRPVSLLLFFFKYWNDLSKLVFLTICQNLVTL